MKIKKTQTSFFPALLLCVFFLLTLSFCTKAESPKKDYGVFLGRQRQMCIRDSSWT